MEQQIGSNPKFKFTFVSLISVGIFAAACLGFIAIAHEMVVEKENNVDTWIFSVLSPLQSPTTTKVMVAITFLGSAYFLLPSYIIVSSALWFKRQHRYAINVAAIGIWSAVVVFCLKAFFKRDRPTGQLVNSVAGYSFPSGHSFSAFTFFGLLIFLVSKTNMHPFAKWTISLLLFAVASTVAFSRVYLHVHYASDVVAGLLLASIWLIASFSILKRIDRRNKLRGLQ